MSESKNSISTPARKDRQKTSVAIYARVSTKEKGQDTENQLAELRQFAAASGWKVANEYIDHASAKSGERDQFKAMFEGASKRKFEILLVWALDRLTREGVAETFTYIRRLLAEQVQFVSYTEAHFRTTGPAGELMIAIAAWIAEQERRRISERTIAGLDRVRAAGVRLGPKPIECDVDEIRRLRARGLSIRKIAAIMDLKHAHVHRLCRDVKRADS
jgi:DNA invertase Pin-like site-specific DNA recombinase